MDLRLEVRDLMSEVEDLKSEVRERRSRGTPLNLTPGHSRVVRSEYFMTGKHYLQENVERFTYLESKVT